MNRPISRPLGRNYAFVAAGAVFIALMAAAGLRAAPGVLMLPLERAFGWDRGTVSSAAAVGRAAIWKPSSWRASRPWWPLSPRS